VLSGFFLTSKWEDTEIFIWKMAPEPDRSHCNKYTSDTPQMSLARVPVYAGVSELCTAQTVQACGERGLFAHDMN